MSTTTCTLVTEQVLTRYLLINQLIADCHEQYTRKASLGPLTIVLAFEQWDATVGS